MYTGPLACSGCRLTRVQVLHAVGDVGEDTEAQVQADGEGLVVKEVVQRPMLYHAHSHSTSWNLKFTGLERFQHIAQDSIRSGECEIYTFPRKEGQKQLLIAARVPRQGDLSTALT